MSDLITKAQECIQNGEAYFYKYLSPNDVGSNGSHQSGVYVKLEDGRRLFPKQFKKGENVHTDIKITWYDTQLVENCRFIYYGKGAKTDEFRITRLNRKFKDGDLLLLVLGQEEYAGFLFNKEQAEELFGT